MDCESHGNFHSGVDSTTLRAERPQPIAPSGPSGLPRAGWPEQSGGLLTDAVEVIKRAKQDATVDEDRGRDNRFTG